MTINVHGTAAFPYTVGPYYYGCVPGQGCATCGTSTAKFPGSCNVSSSTSGVVMQAPTSSPVSASSFSSSSPSDGSVLIIAVVVGVAGIAAIIAAVVGYYYCYSAKSKSDSAAAATTTTTATNNALRRDGHDGVGMNITDVYTDKKGKDDSFSLSKV